MRLQIEATLDYYLRAPTDILLAVEVLPGHDQHIVSDLLTVRGADGPLRPIPGEDGQGRRTWMTANGPFLATYKATVDIDPRVSDISGLDAMARPALPAHVVPYLFPSRYCESDRFEAFVLGSFGELHGGAMVQAMADWLYEHIDYVLGSSNARTTATDSFIQRQGVCRDFAHMLVSFARAAGIPARMVSAYAWQLDPPDFHAVVEVWLNDGWHLVDATRLAPVESLVRIAAGRDATDISFMTIFGMADMNRQTVTVTRIDMA